MAKTKESTAVKDKEGRETHSLYRESQDDITTISDKLSDYWQQKQELSKELRKKEEETEEIVAKMDFLRQSLRENDREKRSLFANVEELRLGVSQEKKQGVLLERQVRELEEAMLALKIRHRRVSTTNQEILEQ